MASLLKDKNRKTKKPNSCRTIQFVAEGGTRKTIRLGVAAQMMDVSAFLRRNALTSIICAATPSRIVFRVPPSATN